MSTCYALVRSSTPHTYMSNKKPQFITNEIYHVYNRGVEKRVIFPQTADYFRMVRDLYELNNKHDVLSLYRRAEYNPIVQLEKNRGNREALVEILAWVLMPNHDHLLLRQIAENGIVKFMHKLGTGYTNYFNTKNERVGPLFQGSFKAIHVDTDDYLRNLVGYIHTNPAALADQLVRSSTPSTMGFLRGYRWSSFQDYLGIGNFPEIISPEFLLEIMGGKEGVLASAEDWLAYRDEKINTLPEIIRPIRP